MEQKKVLKTKKIHKLQLFLCDFFWRIKALTTRLVAMRERAVLDQSNNKDPLSERTFPQKWVYPSDLNPKYTNKCWSGSESYQTWLKYKKKKHSVTVGKMNYSSKISGRWGDNSVVIVLIYWEKTYETSL